MNIFLVSLLFCLTLKFIGKKSRELIKLNTIKAIGIHDEYDPKTIDRMLGTKKQQQVVNVIQ